MPVGTTARTGAVFEFLLIVSATLHAVPSHAKISPVAKLRTSSSPVFGAVKLHAEPSYLAIEFAVALANAPAGVEPTIY